MALPPLTQRKPHDLDFDYPDFLTFAQLPPTEWPMRGWVFLATFVRDVSIGRPVFRVQDTSGRQISVAFYMDDKKALSKLVSTIKIGSSVLGGFMIDFVWKLFRLELGFYLLGLSPGKIQVQASVRPPEAELTF